MAINDKLKDPADANAAYQQYIAQQRAQSQATAGQPAAAQTTGAAATTAPAPTNTFGIKPFKYDFNGDALYQQAAQRYQQLGRQAMMDTMGQAATLTGGYGNSYAQNAGQQAYQGYLQGLHDQLPQFQQMAMNKYQMDYAQYQDNQKLAQAQVDYLISIGVQPDDELLSMAGYSRQYIENAMKQGHGGGGVSGRETGEKSGVDLVREATGLSMTDGLGAATRYVQDQVGGTRNAVNGTLQFGNINVPVTSYRGTLGLERDDDGKLVDTTPIKALDNARGVSQTEYYLRMLAAQNQKK